MQSLNALLVVVSSSLILLALRFLVASRRHRRLPYPPGPQGFPVIGNALDMPSKYAHIYHHELSKTYGTSVSTLSIQL